MKKIFSFIVPGSVLILFLLIMNSGDFLKQSFSEKDDVKKYINELENDVTNDNWYDAKEKMDKLDSAWEIVENRIQFSVEKDRLEAFETTIYNLKSRIDIKDKKEALAQLDMAKYMWSRIGEIFK